MNLSKITYSSTNSWKPLIHVSDWLIFCCGNLILDKKINKNDKNTNLMMKTTTKNAKKVCKSMK